MRPITTLAMCAYLALAAAPALAIRSDYFIKLDGMDPGGRVADEHRETIEISSWQWGETRAQGKVEHEWRIEEGESAPPPAGNAKYGAVGGMHRADGITGGNARESGEKGGTEDINIGVGELQEVGGARTETIGAAQSPDAASGQTTGKRQHKPIRVRAHDNAAAAPAGGAAQFNPKEISVTKQVAWQGVPRPLDRGAVRVKVKFPWAGCRVGARYPALTLGGSAERYELTDAVVTHCGSASSGGESLPMEEVGFNYRKVKVRGWDPEKKEE